ncbi:MAG: CheR family methyltransferase [Candidatus Kapabacteria bacterium]|nr:CheR family methyltransferase [Candidatus Kapabacteria bacterium]
MNDYQEILVYLNNEIGLNVDSVGLLTIARGISNSMKKSGITDPLEFSEKIKFDPLIFNELVEEIKVPETWFFRDAECYNFMKNHLQSNLAQYSSSNPLRVLSAPCSTGEEPYSAAMLALDCGLSHSAVEIIATDISRESIVHAKKGVFRKSSFRNDYNDFNRKYFSDDNGNFKIDEKLKSIPVFIEDNFIKSSFLDNQLKFDFIFCKNLLIYLNDEARTMVLTNIKKLLKDDGALLVGLSEINYFTRNGFEQIKHNMAFACKRTVDKLESISEFKPRENVNDISKTKIKTYSEPKRKPEVKIKERKVTVSPVETFTIDKVKLMADKGDFHGAEKVCNTLLQNEYANSEALYYMGLIQNALKNSDKAADYFKKVLYLNPEHYESLIHISLLYESSGDNERALLFRNRAERVYLKNMSFTGGSE